MIDHFERVGRKRLGDVLVDEKLIAKEQLHEAQGERQRTRSPLGQILVDSGYLSEWDLAKAVAAHYNLPYLDLSKYEPNGDVFEKFPADLAHRERLLAFDEFGRVICIACAEMPSLEILRRIQEITSLTPCLYVSLGSEIRRLLTQHVPAPEEVPELVVPERDEELGKLFGGESQQDWQKLFDIGDEQVMRSKDEGAA